MPIETTATAEEVQAFFSGEGKTVRYIPADMDHARAIEKARSKGLPAPTDFKGAAHEAF